MALTSDSIRENHVVDFVEARSIAWNPAEVGQPPPGHLWRWELEPLGRRPHPGYPHLRLVAIDRSDAAPARPRYDQREASGLAGPACRAGRASLNCTDRWQSGRLTCQDGQKAATAAGNRSSGVPMMDKATGRVVAVIVLLIAIAASLRGYLPGVERADQQRPPQSGFVAALCCGPAHCVAGDRGRGADHPIARSAPSRVQRQSAVGPDFPVAAADRHGECC